MRVFYHPKFAREYRSLPDNIKKIAEDKELLFRKNPFHPQLKTHKLKGALKGFWAFSINQKFRIIFDFSKDTIRFYSVGDHDIYDI